MARRGADSGVVHAGETRREEAGVREVAVQGGGVGRVQPWVLIVFPEHMQAFPLVQVGTPLVLPPWVHGQRVVVVVVMVVIVVGLPVPEGALGLVQPWRGEAVERVIPEQKVPAQRVSAVDVQFPVGIPQRVADGVPVERGVGEPLSTRDGADAHEGGHHASPVQAADAVHGVNAGHPHRHGHGGQGPRVHAARRAGGRRLGGPPVGLCCLGGQVVLFFAFLLHLDLRALLGVLVGRLTLALLGLPARAAVGPGAVHSGGAHVGRGHPGQLLGFVGSSAALVAVAVLLGRVAVLRLVLVGRQLLSGIRVLSLLPLFGFVFLASLSVQMTPDLFG